MALPSPSLLNCLSVWLATKSAKLGKNSIQQSCLPNQTKGLVKSPLPDFGVMLMTKSYQQSQDSPPIPAQLSSDHGADVLDSNALPPIVTTNKCNGPSFSCRCDMKMKQLRRAYTNAESCFFALKYFLHSPFAKQNIMLFACHGCHVCRIERAGL